MKLIFKLPLFISILLLSKISIGNAPTSFYQISYFVDSSKALEVDKIEFQKFKSIENINLNLGFCRYPCWIKIKHLSNGIIDSTVEVKVCYPILDSINFYSKSEKQVWISQTSGELVANKSNVTLDRVFTFKAKVSKSDTSIFYLKIATQGSLYVPIKLGTNNGNSISFYWQEKIYGAYFGALLVMILFNIAILIIMKDVKFLYYSIFIALQAGIHFIFTGHHIVLLPNDWHPYFNHILLFLMYSINVFGLLFGIAFLNLKEDEHVLYRFFLVLLGTSIIVGLLHPFLNYRLIATAVAILYVLTPSTLLLAGILIWKKGRSYARYFVLSWFLFVVSVVLLSIRTFGIWGEAYTIETWVQVGSILDVVLLGLALGDRYNSIERERNKILIENLNYSQQIEENTREQNRILEIKIQERTSELEIAKVKMQEQNDELLQYNSNLEVKVAQRTEELSKLIDHLQEHIVNFKQYAYIVSHNLRAPVARIIGLVSVLDKSKIDKDNGVILDHLDITAKNLDIVVKDMNEILDIKNGKGVSYDFINLFDIIEEFKINNEPQLQETGTSIIVSFENVSIIYSVKFYIRSIIYNLLSNAIKYRHKERKPIIKVYTLLTKDATIVKIEDNGLGFDLEKFGDKIFGLYQRFHTEQEGRGLGLYMVKSQVEFLKGKIQLESSPNLGSTFTITLPNTKF